MKNRKAEKGDREGGDDGEVKRTGCVSVRQARNFLDRPVIRLPPHVRYYEYCSDKCYDTPCCVSIRFAAIANRAAAKLKKAQHVAAQHLIATFCLFPYDIQKHRATRVRAMPYEFQTQRIERDFVEL